ncbi:E3 ubiquitin-protein ligase RNF13-like isoform X2 [Littorina saxatilis]|uniref:E3 ubiquitin-protein ligase RNF13-like isoform X2 n=1 Tax=Littorina saxatilis TaxID=31220 RepID=UPI0038B5622B
MVECRIPGHITGLYIFAVVNLCALLNISLVSADVFVINRSENFTIASFDDKQALFGPDFPKDGLIGQVVYVSPHDACTKVNPPPPGNDLPWIALISRGPCHFDLKVGNAERAGYGVAVVHNSPHDDSVLRMAGGNYSDQVRIPSVFVGYTDGMELAHRFNYTDKFIVVKIQEFSYDDFSYFWPFTVVVSVCFLVLILFSIFKCIRYFQFRRRTRLSTRALKRIPTRKYKKGDHYDTCAICLDDYEEGEKLRVLPCDHTYHCKCIDPWLTKRKKTCPQCKRRVIPGEETDSGSETEGEGAGENTPLLGNNNTRNPIMTQGGVPSYDGRGPAADRRGGRRGPQSVVVVNEARPSEIAAPARAAREEEDSDDSDEELEGAVGGVGISYQQDHECEKTNVIVDIEPAAKEASHNAPDGAGEPTGTQNATQDTEPLTSNDRCSPARTEGSINVAFSSSGSSEEDGNGVAKGEGKKKKRKSNQVV